MSTSAHSSLDILAFWRKVEFFVPYDAQGAWEQDSENLPSFYALQQLLDLDARDLWMGKVRPEYALQGFYVYLNLFPQQALVKEVEALTANGDELAQENLVDYKNTSCFARLQINAQGMCLPDTLEMASAPWAVGRCRQFGWGGLDFVAFEEEAQNLREQLQYHLQQQSVDTHFWLKQLCALGMRYHLAGLDMPGVQALLDALLDALADDADAPRVLSGKDLLLLLELLHQWSYGFQPATMNATTPIIAIQPIWKKIQKNHNQEAEVDEGEEEEDNPQTHNTSILNSFFAADLAKISRAIAAGEHSPALHAYLAPPPQTRVDLYDASGYAAIEARLQPQFLNPGRWPEQAEYALSLMQQFAVNALFHEPHTHPLFSVNGPPGTGKTTLLRDIFAENIVRRAQVLAQLTHVQAAFAGKVKIQCNQKSYIVSRLIPALTGFEMVVVSSNNAAVENITRDLPKKGALGKDFRHRVSYVQSVAHNGFAQSKNAYLTLDEEDAPWGLFSCALGNQKNRKKFRNHVFFVGNQKKGFDPAVHQSIWDWLKTPYPLDFAEAQKRFRHAHQAVETRMAALQDYADFYRRYPTEKNAREAAAHQAAADALAAEKQYQSAQDAQLGAAQLRDAARLQEQARQEAIARHAATRPMWWVRLLRLGAARRWQETAQTLQQAHSLAREALYEQEAACLQAQHAHDHAQKALASAQIALEAAHAACARLHSDYDDYSAQFPDAHCPQNSEALAEDKWQINGIWRDHTLNTLRAELFAHALTLHEAWLHAAAQSGVGFGGNLAAINGYIVRDIARLPAEEALLVWQSLFMLVPVVSSTFAAFARQFGNLDAQSLGCIVIDEAGQALPQAAVGALWRAKRAIVVGDPLQIEPVFTAPAALVNRLEQHAGLNPEYDVSPARVSVQTLADRANPFGANLPQAAHTLWTGSPLRVHRRCADPMFTLANHIAYQNKMIHPAAPDSDQRTPPSHGDHPGASAWVQCAGQRSERQYVAAQGELVCQALRALYARSGELPALFIITPFRKIRDLLQAQMKNADFWAHLPAPQRPKKEAWSRWITTRIGTVHTFQGKEENMVWLVLGCDEDSSGAAAWAAEKPNLLNVALTRAKQRVFIIGDSHLWGKQPYFDHACNTLPHISAQVFLQRAAGEAQT